MSVELACLKAQPEFKDKNYQTATGNLHSHSMDRMVNDSLSDLDSIKKTILEHDHLFKQQVKELHRLYGVQRTLMNELISNLTVADQNRSANACVDLRQYSLKQPNTRIQESEQNDEEPETELTLAIGNRKYSDKVMKKKKYQEQQPRCNVDLLLFPNSINDQFQAIKNQKGLSDEEERSPNVEDCGETAVVSDLTTNRPHWLLHNLGSLH